MVIQPRSEEKPDLLPIFVRGQQLQNSLIYRRLLYIYIYTRLLRFRVIEHISYASIIHTCRSTSVDIIPISIMIGKRRLAHFGHVCRMDSYRLPKIMLQLFGDTGSISRGRGAPGMSYKSALLGDMRNFGIMDMKSKNNCCINTIGYVGNVVGICDR